MEGIIDVVEQPEKNKKIEYEKRWCKYEFIADELKDIAGSLAIKNQEEEEIEGEKKAVTSAFKERTERVKGEIRIAARLYKDGYEMRDIECVVERDFDTGEVRYIRTDTGQVAHTSKMTMVERQRRIEDLLPKEDQEDKPTASEKTDAEIKRESQTIRDMTSEKSSIN